jgi:hypothetical protein
MKSQVDWRHLLVAAVLVIGIGALLWKGTAGGKPEMPNISAPAGPNARTEDAKEDHGMPNPPAGLPTAK